MLLSLRTFEIVLDLWVNEKIAVCRMKYVKSNLVFAADEFRDKFTVVQQIEYLAQSIFDHARALQACVLCYFKRLCFKHFESYMFVRETDV